MINVNTELSGGIIFIMMGLLYLILPQNYQTITPRKIAVPFFLIVGSFGILMSLIWK
jgi:hypothetical protein